MCGFLSYQNASKSNRRQPIVGASIRLSINLEYKQADRV